MLLPEFRHQLVRLQRHAFSVLELCHRGWILSQDGRPDAAQCQCRLIVVAIEEALRDLAAEVEDLRRMVDEK